MPNFKKALDREQVSNEFRKILETSEAARLAGVAGENIIEPVPEYISSPSEHIITNKNNSWIVLGRDREHSRLSGYGGKGHTQCASIDIVVGRMGSDVAEVNEANEKIYVDPNFEQDAARIYLSQKTDIDNYLKLDGTGVDTRSAIALKADQVRIVAREKIKIVTGVDTKNSQGADINQIDGVELVAGNDYSTVQPMVLGDNAVAALERLVEHVDALGGILDTMCQIQLEFDLRIADHFHITEFFATPTTPSEVLVPAGQQACLNLLNKVKRSLLNFKINLASYKITYLSQAGENFVCSRSNKVN